MPRIERFSFKIACITVCIVLEGPVFAFTAAPNVTSKNVGFKPIKNFSSFTYTGFTLVCAMLFSYVTLLLIAVVLHVFIFFSAKKNPQLVRIFK